MQRSARALSRYLKLKTRSIGMQRFKTVEEMEAVPRIRRPDPKKKSATDQVVGQNRWPASRSVTVRPRSRATTRW